MKARSSSDTSKDVLPQNSYFVSDNSAILQYPTNWDYDYWATTRFERAAEMLAEVANLSLDEARKQIICLRDDTPILYEPQPEYRKMKIKRAG